MVMSGSPTLRVSMDSIKRSPLLASASSPAAISMARLATARYTGRSRVCLHFEFAPRDVMRVPSDLVYATLYSGKFTTWRYQVGLANLEPAKADGAQGLRGFIGGPDPQRASSL
jgi:hypothetical protein